MKSIIKSVYVGAAVVAVVRWCVIVMGMANSECLRSNTLRLVKAQK